MSDFLRELIAAATAADGQPPFSDQSLVDHAAGTRQLLTVGSEALPGEALGAALMAVNDGGAEAELVVHPDARRRGFGERLLRDVIAGTDGTLLIWAHGDHPGARALAARYHFEPVRELLQLRARWSYGDRASDHATPAPTEPAKEGGRQPHVHSFRPGVDDAAWLDLNARAFAEHPEQGKLAQPDLDARKAEDWFTADDFLLLWDGEELAGFCWLKVTGGLGEFYAVGVSPDRQGEGIGRALVEAGLNRLGERGIRESNLYVEADNEPAVRLYRSYGFTNHTIDIQYRKETPAQ